MTLTTDEIDLLRASYRDLAREAGPLAEAFYRRVFEIAPEARPLFREEMGAQGAKMMNTLGAVVAQIHDIEGLRPMLADLALRHRRYGVADHHYAVVGEALVWAVARAHGPDFSPELAGAWRKAYDAMARAMLAAARQDAAAARG